MPPQRFVPFLSVYGIPDSIPYRAWPCVSLARWIWEFHPLGLVRAPVRVLAAGAMQPRKSAAGCQLVQFMGFIQMTVHSAFMSNSGSAVGLPFAVISEHTRLWIRMRWWGVATCRRAMGSLGAPWGKVRQCCCCTGRQTSGFPGEFSWMLLQPQRDRCVNQALGIRFCDAEMGPLEPAAAASAAPACGVARAGYCGPEVRC
jgi:hypothetical protein